MTTADPDFCDACGWPVVSCVCDEVDDLDDEDLCVCEHGIGFDEDCEECDEIEYEGSMARRGILPP